MAEEDKDIRQHGIDLNKEDLNHPNVENEENRLSESECTVEVESVQAPEPPEIPEDLKVEKEWADKLHIRYDIEEQINLNDSKTLPPDPSPFIESENMSGSGHPSIYVMPADRPLPPRQPFEPMPPTYMVWAVLATICCCLPAGIVAIIFAANVSSKYYACDYEGARKASERAQIWIIVSIVLGLIATSVWLPFSMLL